jgi:hypothetical protein
MHLPQTIVLFSLIVFASFNPFQIHSNTLFIKLCTLLGDGDAAPAVKQDKLDGDPDAKPDAPAGDSAGNESKEKGDPAAATEEAAQEATEEDERRRYMARKDETGQDSGVEGLVRVSHSHSQIEGGRQISGLANGWTDQLYQDI